MPTLAEALISELLGQSDLEQAILLTFARYHMERLRVHGRDRTGCSSANFLHKEQPLNEKLMRLPSNRQRITYLAEMTAEIIGLQEFPSYLTVLFEIDALFCNDDRHLHNIAVTEERSPKTLLTALQARPFHTTFSQQRAKLNMLFIE